MTGSPQDPERPPYDEATRADRTALLSQAHELRTTISSGAYRHPERPPEQTMRVRATFGSSAGTAVSTRLGLDHCALYSNVFLAAASLHRAALTGTLD